MASTHLSLHYHIVFSTKERRPFIDKEWKGRLHSFMAGCIRTEGGKPIAIGGVADHVHLLIGLRSTHQLAAVVKTVKVASSRWVHQTIEKRTFCWQTGYGAFTVSPSQLQTVLHYIERQETHHSKMSYQEEYVRLLEKAGVVYDERYIW